MKILKFSTFSILLSLLGFISCSKNLDTTDNATLLNSGQAKTISPVENVVYDNLFSIVVADLNAIHNGMGSSPLTDYNAIRYSAQNYYGTGSTKLTIFLNAFNDQANNPILSIKEISTTLVSGSDLYNLKSYIDQVDLEIENSSDASSFLESLEGIRLQVDSSALTANEKATFNSFVMVISGGLGVFQNQNELVFASTGWWDSWGRCAAGTIGGAGLGALGGAATGSFVPVLGNIGCGIAGAIFGGLSGAAASC